SLTSLLTSCPSMNWQKRMDNNSILITVM
ncbi:unnamed protein product, partial [Arctia plantaginis]